MKIQQRSHNKILTKKVINIIIDNYENDNMYTFTIIVLKVIREIFQILDQFVVNSL